MYAIFKKEDTKSRYKDFSNIVCTKLGMIIAYPYICVDEDGEAAHLGGKVHVEFSIATVFLREKRLVV